MRSAKGDGLLRHLHPPGGAAGAGELRALLGGEAAAPAVVDHHPVGAVGGGGGQALRPGAVAGVDESPLLQLGEGGAVDVGAAALVHRLIVPVEAQPLQVPHHLVAPGLGAPVRVQVLQPEDHPPPLAPGRQPGQQTGPQVAQVHPPAGAGGKAAAHRRFVLHGLSSFACSPLPYHTRPSGARTPLANGTQAPIIEESRKAPPKIFFLWMQ